LRIAGDALIDREDGHIVVPAELPPERPVAGLVPVAARANMDASCTLLFQREDSLAHQRGLNGPSPAMRLNIELLNFARATRHDRVAGHTAG
jgi:hypothetical protein